jgi:prepilin-type N-terminal cleavage/methylation domain-containing protein/prepilin-type processing-associated H-X9-DG protein
MLKAIARIIKKMKTLVKRHINKKAFTLIELLVVIAIIAILAAILFPVFGRARENARRSSCQSNLKQVGLGILQYTQDYDEMFPMVMPGADNEALGRTNGWAIVIQPYIKSTQLFQCPSETNSIGDATTNRYSDYCYNTRLGPPNATGVRSISVLEQSSVTIMATDGISNLAHYMGGPASKCEGNGPGATVPTATATPYVIGTGAGWDSTLTGPAYRHLEMGNYLFADGHVKALKPNAVTLARPSLGVPTFALTATSTVSSQ